MSGIDLGLSEFVTGRVAAGGSGVLKCGPAAHGVTWRPTVVSIRCTGTAPAGLATCSIYAGDSPTAPAFVDATYDVSAAATGAIEGQVIRLGAYVWAVWAGAIPGATITMNLVGTKTIPGPRR